jgi:FMN phosphatase YigB (HAD superfamily)
MGKPALVIYKEALQLLGLQPAEVVAIGDSLVRYVHIHMVW